MEKLLTLYPHNSIYKDIFEDFNGTLFSLCSDERRAKWLKYKETYNFSPNHFGNGGSFEHQKWKGLYKNVPEAIELWTVTGKELGIEKAVPFAEFSVILEKYNFISPPRGTGLWLPEALRQQNINFEGRLFIFSPIEPCSGKPYKTVQIVLHRQASFQNGIILGTLEELRPTETWISPEHVRVVQKVLH